MQLQISVKQLKFSREFDFKTLNSKMVRHWNTLSKYLNLLSQWLKRKKTRQATAIKEASKGHRHSTQRRNFTKFEVRDLLYQMGPMKRAESCQVNSRD